MSSGIKTKEVSRRGGILLLYNAATSVKIKTKRVKK